MSAAPAQSVLTSSTRSCRHEDTRILITPDSLDILLASLVTLEAAGPGSHLLAGLAGLCRYPALPSALRRPPNNFCERKITNSTQKSPSARLLHSRPVSPGARHIHENASRAQSHIHCLLTGNFISKAVISQNTYPSFLGRAAVGFAGPRAGTPGRRVTSRHHRGLRDRHRAIIQ